MHNGKNNIPPKSFDCCHQIYKVDYFLSSYTLLHGFTPSNMTNLL